MAIICMHLILHLQKTIDMEANNNINQLSLKNFLSVSDAYSKGKMYGEHLFFVRSENTDNIQFFKYPIRINAFIIVYCSKGKLNINYNFKDITISNNTIFFYRPGTIIQLKSNEEASVSAIMCDDKFTENLKINTKNFTYEFIKLIDNPYIKILPEDGNTLENLLSMLNYELDNKTNNQYHNEFILSVIHTILYKIKYVVTIYYENNNNKQNKICRDNEHFKTFIQILQKYYTQERTVIFYASLMHVSPKYLSSIIKKVSGISANKWIDKYVIIEAKNLLKYSDMSIQEIAYFLNFANQSFFGQYFKKRTGMSPNEYKKKE